jgi:hydrogenase maturation protein HypF
MAKTSVIGLARVSVRGVVQGVGFRPFVYQLARRHNLRGWVCNTSEDVRIEVEGEARDIEAFLSGLREDAPPLARIESIAAEAGPLAGYEKFEIRASIAEAGKYQLVSPDIATCPDCLREVFDPADRRYRYPFTNCTNCGPRFTIIADIPYDRPNTTMKKFRMCPACRKEYDDPLDRRFHAQPNACPVCGPRLELLSANGDTITCDDKITETSELLKQGKIVAVKGLGGFLLACDATSASAVNLLRRRKRRPAKPLAVMVVSLEEINRHCYVNQAEAELLSSPASPIVLMRRRAESNITEAVAPGLDYLGVMLPYTPLHHLLLRETGLPLVMTSGNLSEEPIARDNDEALRRLGGIADYFLVHDRDIYARYDDSVMTVAGGEMRFVRRARGYAPHPIRLNGWGRQVLACGAEEKNTFCLTRDGFAFVSQHIGDMENLETLEHFINTINLYEKLFRIHPQMVACDLHPEYLSTKYARELAAGEGLELFPVQHHHAHIAACLADNGVEGPVIGVSFDGTGYGSDGRVWGGEFLVADLKGFTRAAHLEYLPLPGGALAIKKPYRTAIGYLTALGIDADRTLPLFEGVGQEEIDIIRGQVTGGFNAPLTSSLGRLFDAVAALTGVRGVIEYEAQAAIDLETLASRGPGEAGGYQFSISEEQGVSVIKVGELFTAVIQDLKRKTPQAIIAARFHNTVARIIVEVCQAISTRTGLRGVALSGGVFQNRLLFEQSIKRLESAGLEVYTHHQVPCNDGGVSLGQAAIASINKESHD